MFHFLLRRPSDNIDLVNFKRLQKVSPFTWYQYVYKQPTAPLRERAPIQFLIENNGYAFIDLRETRLHVKLKIVKADGTAVTDVNKVGLVNLSLQSLWKHVEVYWQNRMVSSSDQYYPYKAMLDVLLNYGEDAKNSQMSSQFYYKDSANYMISVPKPYVISENVRYFCHFAILYVIRTLFWPCTLFVRYFYDMMILTHWLKMNNALK